MALILIVLDGHPGVEMVQLVPTKKKRTLNVHTRFGVSGSPKKLEAYVKTFKKSIRDTLGKNPRPVKASEVGLQWHKKGKKTKESDKWADENYIMVSDKS